MAHDVFISYSSKDKVIADAMCANLEGNGIRCWIAPRDILPGRNWGESIIEAIHEANILVLVLSSNSNKSQQIVRELERAVDTGIPIIPFRVEEILPSDSISYFIAGAHWLDALTPPLEEHIAALTRTINILLEPSEQPQDTELPVYEPSGEETQDLGAQGGEPVSFGTPDYGTQGNEPADYGTQDYEASGYGSPDYETQDTGAPDYSASQNGTSETQDYGAPKYETPSKTEPSSIYGIVFRILAAVFGLIFILLFIGTISSVEYYFVRELYGSGILFTIEELLMLIIGIYLAISSIKHQESKNRFAGITIALIIIGIVIWISLSTFSHINYF